MCRRRHGRFGYAHGDSGDCSASRGAPCGYAVSRGCVALRVCHPVGIAPPCAALRHCATLWVCRLAGGRRSAGLPPCEGLHRLAPLCGTARPQSADFSLFFRPGSFFGSKITAESGGTLIRSARLPSSAQSGAGRRSPSLCRPSPPNATSSVDSTSR